MKKLLVALTLTFVAATSQAQTSAADCRTYGNIVGSMTNIRNHGGAIGVALKDLQNLVTSSSPLERNYGKTLTEIAQVIWSKPAGSLDPATTEQVGEKICNDTYRK